jgi:trans-2,3-dihydro-3-hydroxyanthranilate isomerase
VKARFVTADVFTDVAFGGNQLAVFPDASAIPDAALQRVAREFNFSETVFCYPPSRPEHTRRVRIFTPGGEVPFAGHPTVGTAHVLVATGAVQADLATSGDHVHLVLEEGVGPIHVNVRMENGAPAFAQFSVAKLPEIGPQPPSRGVLAKILSLDVDDFVAGRLRPRPVSCGLPFLLVPLRDVAAVSRARVRIDPWETTLRNYWAPEILIFAPDPEAGPARYRARMFAPRLSVPEDPATGSAAACLAGYLAMGEHEREGTLRWTIDQGVEMGRPSRIEVEADKSDGSVTAIRVGVSEGEMEIPRLDDAPVAS